ncbi:UNVERIFIED_CONTAM: hypothetical protein GTU68_039903 [Idotea baltica]|nr:hypothetical protein [Idotea baltica]
MKAFLFMCLLMLNFNEVFLKEKYNILLAVPVASKSLHHLFSSLGYSLAEAGHSVTLFTSFNQTKKHSNLIHFQPDDFSASLQKHTPKNIFVQPSPLEYLRWGINSKIEIANQMWTNDHILKLFERRNEFDAILTPSYVNEHVFPLLQNFRGTYMMVSTPGIEYYTIARSGNWLPPSVVPGIILPYDEVMTFWERTSNLYNLLVIQYPLEMIQQYVVKKELKKYHPEFEDVESYYYKSSLTLINGNFALDSPVPLLPNQVEIGCINAEKPKPLPKDLEEFIKGSGDAGVIYFSLGSFIPGSEIPISAKKILLETFRQIPQRVIWKYEDDDLELPPNVITRKWLPQQDILGHPKTKIFMSHCGNLGTQEARFHGVPVLAVPIAFDQPRNAARLERKHLSVTVNWSEMTVDKLLEAINTLTKDSSYYDRMKKLSNIVQDQKDSPAETAVWWVEYVIRHKGAPHLQYAGKRLHLFSYIMLDVIAFWSAVLLILSFTLVYTCKAMYKKCCGSQKVKKA